MPSQRSKTKVIVGGYFEADLKRALLKQARREGRTMTDLIEEYLWAGLGGRAAAPGPAHASSPRVARSRS